MSKLSDAELVKLQLHKNDWFVRHARRVLQERAAAGKLEKETPDALRVILTDNTDVSRRLRALWALEATGRLLQADANALIASNDVALRAWGFRCALTYTGERDVGEAFTPGEALGREASEYVLLQVTAALSQRAGRHTGYAPILAAKLSAKSDPQLALAVWYRVADELTRARPRHTRC